MLVSVRFSGFFLMANCPTAKNPRAVFTIFRLIWIRTDFRINHVDDQSNIYFLTSIVNYIFYFCFYFACLKERSWNVQVQDNMGEGVGPSRNARGEFL